MSYANAAPLLLFIIVGLLLGLLGWVFLRIWRQVTLDAFLETRDDVLVGLLALAVFALGAFLTLMLLGLH